eukprot:215013-Chlamydomonas_euryale.AAC.2
MDVAGSFAQVGAGDADDAGAVVCPHSLLNPTFTPRPVHTWWLRLERSFMLVPATARLRAPRSMSSSTSPGPATETCKGYHATQSGQHDMRWGGGSMPCDGQEVVGMPCSVGVRTQRHAKDGSVQNFLDLGGEQG